MTLIDDLPCARQIGSNLAAKGDSGQTDSPRGTLLHSLLHSAEPESSCFGHRRSTAVLVAAQTCSRCMVYVWGAHMCACSSSIHGRVATHE